MLPIPKVTAVMCTGQPGRLPAATAAVRSFCQQNYPRKELLIFNHSLYSQHEFRLLDYCHIPANIVVREEMTPPFKSLGLMRSAALDLIGADTRYVIQWDDDDWSHPSRITRQVNAVRLRPGFCCVLGYQVRYSFETNTAFVHSNVASGIAGTILHPNDGCRYPDEHGTEDSSFLKEHYLTPGRHFVLADAATPELYLRFFHGSNLCAAEHVMKVYAHNQWRDCWVSDAKEAGALTESAREYLLQVLCREYERDLYSAIVSVYCLGCARQYCGTISYQQATRKRGRSRQPKPPFRWATVWESSGAGSSPYQGICRACYDKGVRRS